MRLVRRAAWAAAVGWCWAGCYSASAQYRVSSDGHALDANNRVGSGGYNAPSQYQTGNPTAQDIFLGNVTGLSAFKGGTPYRDPYAFQGATPFLPSQVLQQQSGVSSPTAPPTYNKPQVYYNADTHVAPPPGYQEVPGTGSYYATPAPVQATQDYRLGDTLNIPLVDLPKPGDAIGVGPVDPTASMTPSYLTAAPLNGAQLLAPTVVGQLTSGYQNSRTNSSVITNTMSGLSASDIQNLRGEVSLTAASPPGASPLNGAALVNGAAPVNGNTPGAVPVGGSASPGNGPIQTSAFGTQPLNTRVNAQLPPLNGAATPGAGNFSTGQSNRQFLAPLPLPPPGQQSQQYAKLKTLLDQYQAAHPASDEDANRLFQAAVKARRQYEQSLIKPGASNNSGGKTSASPLPGSGTSAGNKHSDGVLPVPSDNAPPAPLEIGSIGQSINAQGLRKLVQDGENLSRHQQFKDAISKFLDARSVAPNNMLIAIDLANAELGAGFYQQSEAYLRDAFSADPALLMGRYDLKGIIGDDRLQIMIADLKRVASGGDSATPVFLLAYVAYSTGDTDKAVEYLRLAETRAGGQDDLIRSLGEHWSLSQGKTAATQPAK